MQSIAMVMRTQRLEWFRHVKRKDETENIQAIIAEMKMEGKRPRGRPNIREEWATDRERRKGEKQEGRREIWVTALQLPFVSEVDYFLT